MTLLDSGRTARTAHGVTIEKYPGAGAESVDWLSEILYGLFMDLTFAGAISGIYSGNGRRLSARHAARHEGAEFTVE